MEDARGRMEKRIAIVSWGAKLGNGKLVYRIYGDKAGFHYYEDDGRGIFWFNDPKMKISQTVRSLGLQEQLQAVRERYHKADVPGH